LTTENIRRLKFAPILTATVLTVLLLWLFKSVAQVFLLLFLGILISLYLGAIAEWLERRARFPSTAAFATAVLGSVGALVLLGWILVPPVVTQTEALIKSLPDFFTSWEHGLDAMAAKFPAIADIFPPGQHRVFDLVSEKVSGMFGDSMARVFSAVNVAIDIFAVAVMGIYLALHPALYRE
jgi:predicted PurR-regulated permease PerM